jgi:hypothetical protein
VEETLDQRSRHAPAALDGRARRPWLVEFAGTPRAGKTTVIHALEAWLKEDGWRVHLIDEQAAWCPVPNKNSPHFNVWTTCSTICSLVEGRYSNADIVLVDRGLFDALCWMHWHQQRMQPVGMEPDVFEGLVRASKIVVDLIDLVVVMIVDPVYALRRDSAIHPRDEPGAIMNLATLQAINHSIGTMAERCAADFRLQLVDTSGFTETETQSNVEQILRRSLPARAPADAAPEG